jgi:hypothetical protein
VIKIVGPPAGAAYSFMANLGSYNGIWWVALVSGGLLYLQFNPKEKWSSPFHCYLPFTVFSLISSLFLIIVPFIPPQSDYFNPIPFYVFPVTGMGIILVGLVYWLFFARILPRIGHYRINVTREMLSDGAEVVRYKKEKMQKLADD